MFNTSLVKYAAIPVVMVLALVVLAMFNAGATAAESDGFTDWSVGDIVTVPHPDNPSEALRMTVLSVDSRGIYEVIDPDGDVFSCLGQIGAGACEYTGMNCPMPATSWALRTPGTAQNAKWLCESVTPPQTRADKPQGYVDIPQCPAGQRLWVDMSGDRLIGYRCAE